MSGGPKVSARVSAKVSVCLPCRNAAATLPAALDSLLGQTLPDFEIIAVDDGSDDATWDILCDYARRDNRVRPLHQPHQGVALAWNAACAESRAPYIARMDADDLCLPRRLELQAALLDADQSLGLVSGRVRFGGCRTARAGYAAHVDWLNSLLTPEDISASRFVDSPIANPSVMFRRELVDQFGGALPNTGDAAGAQPFPEDYEQWLRWLEGGVRMGKVAEEILVWNDPPTRLSRTASEYGVEAFARVKAQYLWRWLARHNRRHPRVWVWGAGRVSRQKMAPLVALGLAIEAFVDIDAKKIGQSVHGIPVLPRTAIPPYSPSAPFLLANVASRGAREEITAWLEGLGYQMGVGAVAVG
ncbi:MAG: glycosyltransferase [Humidesulfovibrio sp.]|uniref:glycosyltransferase n=1 Tax=Humidesulfovibrio sp. TaxID=2910988 RepID=UPI0027E9DF42|nr:glycosyltransferase [Humidesulfovibrio sp.]MDQ7835350.1 glycosyltransferase [Humidesulfovibrio sp.]